MKQDGLELCQALAKLCYSPGKLGQSWLASTTTNHLLIMHNFEVMIQLGAYKLPIILSRVGVGAGSSENKANSASS